MTETMTHTSLPWSVSGVIGRRDLPKAITILGGPEQTAMVFVYYDGRTMKSHVQSHAEAQFIVKACNSYYETQAIIEAKDAEIARLREALEPVRTFADQMSEQAMRIGLEGTYDWDRVAGSIDIFGIQDKARADHTQIGEFDDE